MAIPSLTLRKFQAQRYTQRNWAVIEREAYSVVCPLVHYRNVIFGAPIIDHVYKKLIKFTSIFYKVRSKVSPEVLKLLYLAFVLL